LAKDVTLTIDGTSLTVPAGTLLVEAAKAIRTDIPVYCYHPKLGPAGLCRICLVDVEKTPKLQIACNTAATEGMVVHTYGPKVEAGRRAVLEFLLLNHPLDCPICDKGGECDLQDFTIAYGRGASRLADPKTKKPKAVELGPTIVLDNERCIVCQRCSRFDEIITQERSLVVKDRGQSDIIATATGAAYLSNFSGNVTELCPVGALTSKTYRFKSRPWDLERTATTCLGCSVGCALNIDERHGAVLRTMSEPSDDAQSDGWLCDRGRYNVGFYSDPRRLTAPLLREGDDWVQIAWDDAIELWAKNLRDATAAASGALGGGCLTNEEAWLFQYLVRARGGDNLDWRTGRQRQASASRFPGSYADLETAQAIVAIGRPPSQTAPVMDLRIRKAVAHKGAQLFTVGLHRARSSVPEKHVAEPAELAGLLEGFERIAFVWDGIDLARGAEAAKLMTQLAAKGAAVVAFVPGEQPNARGAETLGLVPRSGGLDAFGMFDAARGGKLNVLSILGANPVLHHPSGAAAVRAALARVPFVVVSELFMTETAALANLVLPARGAFEKSGHVTDMTGTILPLRAGHRAPEGTLADGEMLVALAAALGVELPAPDAIEAQAMSAASTPAGFADVALSGTAPSRRESEGSLVVAIAAHPFAGGGTLHHDESLHELRPLPSATLSPATALAAGVSDGETVDLAVGQRVVHDLLIAVDDGAIDGAISIVDGIPAAPANDLLEGEMARLINVRSVRALAAGGAAG
jgi:NADH-quinone oxidoreductase subunit G